jgi:hypothetical protein
MLTTTYYFGAFVSTGGLVKLITIAGGGSTRGIYTVSDNGSAISTSRKTLGDYRVIKGSDDGRYILVNGGTNAMVRSTDYGESFNSVTGFIVTNDMAVSYTGQYMIASGSGYKLWKSSDFGANWTNITASNALVNGLPNPAIYTSTTTTWGACTISYTGQYMSVAGFFNQGTFQNKAYVFISSDYGANWKSKLIISTTTDPGISTSTMSYNDTGIPIRLFIATYNDGIFYIDF